MVSLTLAYSLDASPPEIYPYFLEFEKFGGLHPYMVEVKKLQENTFTIREKLLLYGFIPMRPVYDACVEELQKGKSILYTSQVKKGVHLTIRFDFSENEKGGTIISEIIKVEANKIIALLFIGLMKKAHKRVVENLAIAIKRKTSR